MRVPGVRDAKVSLEEEQVTVEFDEHETDMEKIRQSVDETGYRLAA
jgi:copper chaperone CopZ